MIVSSFVPVGKIVAYGDAGDDNIQVAGTINLPVWLYGQADNDRLNAGNGGSLLIGGDGNDDLLGGNGRDIMVGGQGADRLTGNANDDILIAGFTKQDDPTQAGHETYWNAVLDLWNSTAGFTTWVNSLRTKLLPEVVDDYFAYQTDFLNGAAGNDWLILWLAKTKSPAQQRPPTRSAELVA